MSNIVPFDTNNVPAHIQNLFNHTDNTALSEGVVSGFPVVSYRGSVWRIKSKGEEHIIKDAHTGDPARSVQLVLIKASPKLSKIYYSASYTEGDDNPPDCFSTDGVVPDPSITTPQCTTCAACPHNVWGSKITPNGSKTKACSDSRRVVVVPPNDIKNETVGGPMLLRVPAASLADLDLYGRKLAEHNVPYNSVITKVSFDPDASYPKLHFEAVGFLDEYQVSDVMELLEAPEVDRILSEFESTEPTAPDTGPVETTSGSESEPPQQTATAAAPPPAPKKKRGRKKKAAEEAAEPAANSTPPTETAAGEAKSDIDAMLDNVLSGLGG